jgi:signal transduction histidine kinase
MKTAGGIVSLIDRINTYVRTREAPLNLERFSLKEVLDGVRAEFAAPMRERGVRWVETGAFPSVLADRLSMERVFRNLVDNALKYGGPRLSEIRVECEEKSGGHILYIKDDGVGIRDEDAEALFRPFQRHASSKGVEGSGLGLAIVRELVEKHHGKVWVAPFTGRGTTFCILLP